MKQNLIINPLKTSLRKVFYPFDSPLNTFLIRHAESQFNIKIKNLEKIKNEMHLDEFLHKKAKIRFNHELLDCEITELGKNQCYEAGKNLKSFRFKYIFVSPLRRCLMTCQNVLDAINHNNPHPLKPEIIVHPLLFEKIEDSCDILNDVNKNMKDFSHYNWDLFSDLEHLPIYQLKYCDMRVDNIGVNYYEKAIDSYTKNKNYDHHKIVIDAMEYLGKHEKYIESSKKTLERLKIFQKFVSSFTDLKKEEKVLVVGHSILFKHYTSKFINETDHHPTEDAEVLKNCEVAGLSFN